MPNINLGSRHLNRDIEIENDSRRAQQTEQESDTAQLETSHR